MKINKQIVKGYIVDIPGRTVFPGAITIYKGCILEIREIQGSVPQRYILPGFIDAHIHIESSMMVPSEFARIAVQYGTVATVSDPHEIANVLGVNGVEYMIDNGSQVPLKFYFGAPSCVPATSFETAGAEINVSDIQNLLARPEVKYLAEMMNWPGVLNRDSDVMKKIKTAWEVGKPVDGHAPGLTGEKAERYAQAGISTDHECFTLEEAMDKLAAGMKVIIREGSAARNFDALIPLMTNYPAQLMFCSDDKHPNELILGHIGDMVKRALQKGYDLFDVLQVACLNPIDHYGLDVGRLKYGDPADFIIVDTLTDFKVLSTYIDGEAVFHNNRVLFSRPTIQIVNHFECDLIDEISIQVHNAGDELQVINSLDGQLVTTSSWERVKRNSFGNVVSDVENDILKLVVVNRYQNSPPAVGFVRGFGLKSGAIASTVAHDSHNVIAVGVEDHHIVEAVNRLILEKGGICAVHNEIEESLALPVAGLMSVDSGEFVAEKYSRLDEISKIMGSSLTAPFMTLSFMALLVIPDLKLSDQGLFDGVKFEFSRLFR